MLQSKGFEMPFDTQLYELDENFLKASQTATVLEVFLKTNKSIDYIFQQSSLKLLTELKTEIYKANFKVKSDIKALLQNIKELERANAKLKKKKK